MYEASKQVTIQETASNAVMDFELGAIPTSVEILNLDTGAHGVWHNGMNDGEFFVKDAGGGAGGTGLKTTNGITIIHQDELEDINTAGDVQKSSGFSFGTLADFNDNAEALSFLITY